MHTDRNTSQHCIRRRRQWWRGKQRRQKWSFGGEKQSNIGLNGGKKKEKARKWNKNRLMMELVSRWGSPLTSEAPHSLAYPNPVKKEGPHHRSFWLPRLQHQADSFSFCLVVGGPNITRLWKATDRRSVFWMTGQSLTPQSRSRDEHSAKCHFRPAGFSKVTDSVWELVATESEAWHLNYTGNMTACCRVSHINHCKVGCWRNRSETGRRLRIWE